MTTLRILTIFFAAFILTEARWHLQKREITSICDPMSNAHSKVLCYCINDSRRQDQMKSADCSLVVEDVKPNDNVWDLFEQLKSALKLTLTKSRGISLHYIPTQALQHLENLIQLDVKYGNIEKVHRFAFANLSNVEEISLTDSQIRILEDHSFAHLRDLTAIKLDKNNIVEINRDVFIDLPSLERLFLTENDITTIHDKAFVHLSGLKELEINVNKLFSLNNETFFGLKKLQKLDLSNNNLEVIGDNTFYPLKNLRSLNLDGNKIQMLDDKAFNGLAKLQVLSLAHNKLSNIVNDNVFAGLESLVSLILRANEIKEWNPKPIDVVLKNFHSNESHLDVEDNFFPCDCRLDWFMDLMNQTRSKNLKIALENLKCLPDLKLSNQWNNMEETDRNSGTLNQDSVAEYEYYDESQLNGKLFYTDVRDLLHCGTNKLNFFETKIAAKETKAVTNTDVTTSTTTKPIVPNTNKSTVNNFAKPQVNHGILDLSVDETTPKPKDADDNEIVHENKPDSYTTTKLINVSAKPVNFYDNMASDEAKPDRLLKAQRSLQMQSDLDEIPNQGHKNVGCVTLISLICFRLFH